VPRSSSALVLQALDQALVQHRGEVLVSSQSRSKRALSPPRFRKVMTRASSGLSAMNLFAPMSARSRSWHALREPAGAQAGEDLGEAVAGQLAHHLSPVVGWPVGDPGCSYEPFCHALPRSQRDAGTVQSQKPVLPLWP